MHLSLCSVKGSIHVHFVGIVVVHQHRMAVHVTIVRSWNVLVDVEVNLVAVTPSKIWVGLVLLVFPLDGS